MVRVTVIRKQRDSSWGHPGLFAGLAYTRDPAFQDLLDASGGLASCGFLSISQPEDSEG